MYKIGNTYTDAESGRTYECQSVITVSPTLITGKAGKYTTYSDVTFENAVEGAPANTMVLVDEEGNQVVAVLVDEEVDFTATADDIREGMIAATDDGVTVGEKFIPSYHTTEGSIIITNGKTFSVKINVQDFELYDYTKFQAIICPFKTSLAKSVACEKVVINDNLYEALSTEVVSEVSIDPDNKSINLGITNTSGAPYLIRFITYKEVY